MVAQETQGFILIQAPQGSLRLVWGGVLYAQGACSRGYKPRSREGPDPKSLWCCEREVLDCMPKCVCVCVCHSDCVFSSPPLRTSAPPFILQGVHVYKGSSVGMPVRSEWFLRSSEAGPLFIYGVSGSVGPLSWWWWPPVALLVQGLQPTFSC
jgi:hypothetical protein